MTLEIVRANRYTLKAELLGVVEGRQETDGWTYDFYLVARSGSQSDANRKAAPKSGLQELRFKRLLFFFVEGLF